MTIFNLACQALYKNMQLILICAIFLSACSQSAQTPSEPATSSPEYGESRSGDLDDSAKAATIAEKLNWRDLMPEDELDAINALNEGRADPSLMSQFVGASSLENQIGTFNTVAELDGLHIQLPGYLLPLDYAERGSAREFLLVPYHGACVHYPPPPPNQLVYLKSEKIIDYKALWEPVWVEGILRTQRIDTDIAATAYTMTDFSVTPF